MAWTIDFETRAVADLKKVGTYLYARHPETEPLCMAFGQRVEDVQLWHPGFEDLSYKQAQKKSDRLHDDIIATPEPLELFEAIILGEEIWAHNAWFERNIWESIMVPRFGWPKIDPQQWRCSAAVAASFSLRRKLEHVSKDLGCAHTKDMIGHRVMDKITKPRKPTKADPDSKWHQKASDLRRVFSYCMDDVRAEIGVETKLRPLIPDELETWQMDQEINMLGMPMDVEMIKGALRLGKQAEESANAELHELTDGAVSKATQREDFKKWLKREGVRIPTVIKKVIDKETGEETLEEKETTARDQMAPLLKDKSYQAHVLRAMEVFLTVNKASTKKYKKMLSMLAADGRIRDILRYWAATTGRWGGSGVQPQNFPRRAPKPKILEQMAADIKHCDYDEFCMLHGEDEIMTILSQVLRGTIHASEGHEFLRADMSAIEARGTFWIAGQEDGLEIFRKIDAGEFPNQDFYTWQATKILGRTITKDDEEDRQTWGKVPVLFCGYQGGVGAVDKVAPHLSEEVKLGIVRGYRESNPRVVDFWYEIERVCIEAVRRGPKAPALTCADGKLRVKMMGAFLAIRLPSGRLIHYYKPELRMVNRFGKIRPQVHFHGYATYKPGLWLDGTVKTKVPCPKCGRLPGTSHATDCEKYSLCSTYGGKLTENVVQALCRDLMRDGMRRVRSRFANRGLQIVLTVHDEVLAEAPIGAVSLEEFTSVLSEVPEWAPGFPIAWDGWVRRRYGK